MQLHIEKNTEELYHRLADWICNYISQVLESNDRFTWALSGGNSPKELYKLLAQSPYKEKIQWNRLHIFFGDERVVPADDDRNNGKMASESLLKEVPVPADQIYFMRTDIDAEKSAAEYEKILHLYFDNIKNSFDLVLLGMGEDGHTLSLFPGSAITSEKNSWVKPVYAADQQVPRISLTPAIVNCASQIVFLVTGEKKAVMLKKVLEENDQPDALPAKIIQPLKGELHWFADGGASALLTVSK